MQLKRTSIILASTAFIILGVNATDFKENEVKEAVNVLGNLNANDLKLPEELSSKSKVTREFSNSVTHAVQTAGRVLEDELKKYNDKKNESPKENVNSASSASDGLIIGLVAVSTAALNIF